jgi:hypothetical protein
MASSGIEPATFWLVANFNFSNLFFVAPKNLPYYAIPRLVGHASRRERYLRGLNFEEMVTSIPKQVPAEYKILMFILPHCVK